MVVHLFEYYLQPQPYQASLGVRVLKPPTAGTLGLLSH